ncbi:hypothetical protein CEDDRAFT_00052 [Frankia sp. CeD]|nr:hypothetical protein CEDDRAFT_00052 [Frankia sp. CeD]
MVQILRTEAGADLTDDHTVGVAQRSLAASGQPQTPGLETDSLPSVEGVRGVGADRFADVLRIGMGAADTPAVGDDHELRFCESPVVFGEGLHLPLGVPRDDRPGHARVGCHGTRDRKRSLLGLVDKVGVQPQFGQPTLDAQHEQ